MSATEEEDNEFSSGDSSYQNPASSPSEPDPPFDDSDFDSVDTVLSYYSSTDDYATFSDLSSDTDQEVPSFQPQFETALNRLFKFPVKNYARKSRHAHETLRLTADTFNKEVAAADPLPSTSAAAASRENQPTNFSPAPSDGDNHDELYPCANCQNSASPLWLGCNRDCYKKRGKQGEKKLAPFLEHLEASRGLNVE